MKQAVVENLCPELKIPGSKPSVGFDVSLVEASHDLEHGLAQPCSDLLKDCSLNSVDLGPIL